MSRYGLFRFGSLKYALPLMKMFKIVHQRPGYRLPRLPASVAEVVVEQDTLVPLLTLSELADAEPAEVRSAEYKVLVESEAGLIAFPAIEACGIVAEQKGRLEVPEDGSVTGITASFVCQDEDYKVLDIDSLAFGIARQV